MIELTQIAEFIVWFAVFLFTLSVHEASHALVATLGGDQMAYRGGQVSLSPVPHMRREPLGMILVPIVSFFAFGWMMGWASTPYDPEWGARHPRRLAAMSAAGPASHFVLLAIGFAILKGFLAAGVFTAPGTFTFSQIVVPAPGTPSQSILFAVALSLSVLVNLNLLLGLFNLIPLPPLDGAGVVQGLFPGSVGALLQRLQGNPMGALIGLVIAWQVFGYIAGPAFRLLLRLLYG